MGDEMEYSLNAGEWNKVFAVPSSVVDKYIKLASGNALKLLLYLTRHGGESFTAEILRAELGFEELGELEDAALFWVQRGIISAKNTKNAAALSAASSEADEVKREVSEVPKDSVKIPEKRSSVVKAKPAVISNGDIGRSIKASPEIKMLFEEAEKMYGRTLHANERQTIAQLTEHYGLPCEVSLMLLGYCYKVGKLKPAYISSVAEGWANDEITTVKLADKRIKALEKQSGIEERICAAMGLTSRPSASMREFIKLWAVDAGFSEEMIMLAYDKTIDGAGKWSAAYAGKILEGWKAAGILTPEAAEKADEEYRKSKGKPANSKEKVTVASGKKTSFDTNRLRSQIMNNYKK